MGGRATRRAIALLLVNVILAATACTRPKPKEVEKTGLSQAEKVLAATQPAPEQTVVSVGGTLIPSATPTLEVPVVSLPTIAATSVLTTVLTPMPEESPAPPESSTTHTVQRGETLFSVGQKYGIPWLDIAAANGISYPYWIMAGQILTIPLSGAPVAPTSERSHIVQREETLYSIGLRYGVSWQAIAQANGIVNANQIFVGQRLVIP